MEIGFGCYSCDRKTIRKREILPCDSCDMKIPAITINIPVSFIKLNCSPRSSHENNAVKTGIALVKILAFEAPIEATALTKKIKARTEAKKVR